MKRFIGLMVLGVALVGYVALGTERTDAPPSKENPRSSTEQKVESSRELPVQESATITDGTAVTEEEAPEIFRAFREYIATGKKPARELSVQSVETAGGVLAILEKGDGVVRVVAFTVDRENPDLEDASQGIAFSAIITKDGIEVSSVDKDSLARFIGKGDQQSATVGGDGGVAAAGCEGVQLPGGTFSCIKNTCSGVCRVQSNPEGVKYCDCQAAPQE